jgi:primosomal protein N' (replication factor Y)
LIVAEIKPLRLKVQKSAPQIDHRPASNLPLARVLVDTGVMHLDEPFDYLVSEQLDESAQPGHLVAVSFHGREVQGYIIERSEIGDRKISGLKYIDRVLSTHCLLLPEQYQLFQALANRYACSIWAIIGAAIPARIATAEKNFSPLPIASRTPSESAPSKIALSLPLNSNRWTALADLVKERVRVGQVLMVVPEESDLEVISAILEPIFGELLIVQSSARTASVRYRNYLHIAREEPSVIVSTRSGLFAPLVKNSTIIIFEESSPSHYEKRYPGWNSRDVALLRTHHTLIFVGDSWSTELARLIDIGYIERKSLASPNSRNYQFNQSRDSHLATISRGLRRGSVLISLASPSPLTGLLCRKCRNRALCKCGGALIATRDKKITCSLCTAHYSPWNCQHCQHTETTASKKDPAVVAESLARAFPGHRILISTANHRLHQVKESGTLVIATIGHEPAGEYAAVVLLDGEFLINRPGLRTEESLLGHWLSLVALSDESAEIFVSLPKSHPVAIALASEDGDRFLSRTLADRAEVQMPPYYRFALVDLTNRDLASLTDAAQLSGIFTMVTQVSIDSLNTRVILRGRVEQSAEFSEFFRSFLRYRSLKGLSPVTVRIDPYSF